MEKAKCYEVGKRMLLQGEGNIFYYLVGFIFLCAGSSSRFMFQEKFLYPLDLKPTKTLIEILL
jgi:hypothetical protein